MDVVPRTESLQAQSLLLNAGRESYVAVAAHRLTGANTGIDGRGGDAGRVDDVRHEILVDLGTQAAALTDADIVMTAVRDSADGAFRPVAVRGVAAHLYRTTTPRPFPRWAGAPGRPVARSATVPLGDLGLQATSLLAPDTVRTYLVGQREDPGGLLATGSTDPDPASGVGHAALQALAAWAGERMRRLEEDQRYTRQTRLVARLSRRTSQVAGAAAAAGDIADLIADAGGFASVWLAGRRDATTPFTTSASQVPARLLTDLTGVSGPSAIVQDTAVPLWMNAYDPDASQPWIERARSMGYGDVCCVPVFDAGELAGTLGALHPAGQSFHADDLATLELAAALLGPLAREYPEQRGASMILRALSERHADAWEHGQRVAAYARAILQSDRLGAQHLPGISAAATLHDVGKIGVPDAVLNKPGPLTPDEWAVMETHPKLGHELLAPMRAARATAAAALEHQERYDGRGYPAGLAGDAIHPVARIVSVADALDAMTSDRPYRARMDFDAALAEIKGESGRQFDPRTVEALGAAANAGTLQADPIFDNPGLTLRRSGRDPGV